MTTFHSPTNVLPTLNPTRAATPVLAVKGASNPSERTVPTSSLLHSRLTPRWVFNQRKLDALTASIQERGVLEPLMVRPAFGCGANQFEIVKGERRFRAALQAGLTELPVIVRELNDAEARQIWMATTMHRANVSVVEQSEAIMELLMTSLNLDAVHVKQVLMKMLVAQRERSSLRFLLEGFAGYKLAEQVELILRIFEEIGRLSFQSFVTNRLPIFDLAQPILEALRLEQIQLSDALFLRGVPPEQVPRLLEERRNGWSHARMRQEAQGLDEAEVARAARIKRLANVLKKADATDDFLDGILDQLEIALNNTAARLY